MLGKSCAEVRGPTHSHRRGFTVTVCYSTAAKNPARSPQNSMIVMVVLDTHGPFIYSIVHHKDTISHTNSALALYTRGGSGRLIYDGSFVLELDFGTLLCASIYYLNPGQMGKKGKVCTTSDHALLLDAVWHSISRWCPVAEMSCQCPAVSK